MGGGFPALIVARDELLVEETLRNLTEIVDMLKFERQTAAGAQRAVDALRGVWGDRADEWLHKSGLD